MSFFQALAALDLLRRKSELEAYISANALAFSTGLDIIWSLLIGIGIDAVNWFSILITKNQRLLLLFGAPRALARSRCLF